MLTRRHYVIFYNPGTLFSETSTRPIESWDPKVAAKMATSITERYNQTPYGFRFTTRLESDPVEDGEGGELKVEPKRVNESGMYFLNAKVKTSVDFEGDQRNSILLSNMRANGWPTMAENINSSRSVQPFEERDFVVDQEGTILEAGHDPYMVEYRNKQRAAWDARVAWVTNIYRTARASDPTDTRMKVINAGKAFKFKRVRSYPRLSSGASYSPPRLSQGR